MANYDPAIAFVIGLEDTHPSGQVTHDADGATRYGLLDRWHPDLVAKGFYTLPQDQALALAKECYRTEYWNRIKGDQLTSDKIAAQLLSLAVNDGVVTAVKMAQVTVGAESDGVLGPHTLSAINATDENSFLEAFDIAAKAHYDAVIVVHPEKTNDLNGWYNRVDAINQYQG